MAYAAVLTALADPTRRQILETLREGPLSVGQLADRQPVSRPAVSQHLRVLEEASLVRAQPRGNRRVYRIERQGLEELRAYLEEFWSDVLTAYGDRVAQVADNE